MKIVKIKSSLYQLYKKDGEILHKEDRPCVLIIRLDYKEKKYDFAVPLRSNISPTTPKSEYFALPNRQTTKKHHHHGIQFSKMFPVTKAYFEKYRTENNMSASITSAFINKNEKEIVSHAQSYLDAYASGKKPQFSTDIDYLLSRLYPQEDTESIHAENTTEDDQTDDPFYSAENQDHLQKSIQQLEQGKGTAHDLIEDKDNQDSPISSSDSIK